LVGARWLFRGATGLFKDGRRLLFWRQHHARGRFTAHLDYYLTRFPARTVRFVNAAYPGDSAGARWTVGDDVVASVRQRWPSCSAVNDVGRGLYGRDPASSRGRPAARAGELCANMERLPRVSRQRR
jgi:hypothetical protein